MISPRRPLAAPALAAVALLTLAGCAGSGSPDDTASPTASTAAVACAPEGDAAADVTVSDTLGVPPEVSFETPFSVDTTERATIVEGDGRESQEGDSVTFAYTLYAGSSTTVLDQGGYTDESQPITLTIEAGQYLDGLLEVVNCTTEGSRLVGAITAADAFGSTGQTELGVAPDETVLFVIDMLEVTDAPTPTPTPELPEPLPRAEGAAQALPEGFPTVTLADDGNPTVTIPDADPPAELQIAASIVGEGAVVPEGATVAVHYKGLNWRTGEVFDESWARGEPSTFGTAQVIPGFAAALVGQTVGSQVVAIIPPDDGYGPSGGNAEAGIEATDTIVFVVDILASTS